MGGLVVAQDMATVACGLLNAGYFSGYWWRRNGSRGRRIGAAALAVVSAAAVVEQTGRESLVVPLQGLEPWHAV